MTSLAFISILYNKVIPLPHRCSGDVGGACGRVSVSAPLRFHKFEIAFCPPLPRLHSKVQGRVVEDRMNNCSNRGEERSGVGHTVKQDDDQYSDSKCVQMDSIK